MFSRRNVRAFQRCLWVISLPIAGFSLVGESEAIQKLTTVAWTGTRCVWQTLFVGKLFELLAQAQGIGAETGGSEVHGAWVAYRVFRRPEMRRIMPRIIAIGLPKKAAGHRIFRTKPWGPIASML